MNLLDTVEEIIVEPHRSRDCYRDHWWKSSGLRVPMGCAFEDTGTMF